MSADWDAAKSAYLAARADEEAYDREVWNPQWLLEPNGRAIEDSVSTEMDRLMDRRSDAEDSLMQIPSPTAADFAFKYSIAKGGKREADQWDEMLDYEAQRFAASPPTASSSGIQEAFLRWKRAELASHYADHCPDDVMDQLVDASGEAFEAMMALPSATAADMALKAYALTILVLEPKLGMPPFAPDLPDEGPVHVTIAWRALVADIYRLAPIAAEAAAAPHRDEFRRAA